MNDDDDYIDFNFHLVPSMMQARILNVNYIRIVGLTHRKP